MASNEFSLNSSSDSEVSEIEDYEIEVEGLPNSSDHANEETQKWACLVRKTKTLISSLFSLRSKITAHR